LSAGLRPDPQAAGELTTFPQTLRSREKGRGKGKRQEAVADPCGERWRRSPPSRWMQENCMGKFCGFVGRSRAKKLSASGGFAP